MRLTLLALPTAALVVAAAVACTSSSTSPSTSPSAVSSAACSFTGAIPAIPASPVTADELGSYSLPSGVTPQQYAEAEAYRYLDSFVGQYLRGEVTTYYGTLSAHDNESVLGVDCQGGSTACADQSIAEGPAVASFALASGVASLGVHSLTDHKYVTFQQTKGDAGVTTVSLVLSDSSAGGNTGTCTGCVPSFVGKPETIAFTNLKSTAEVAVNVGTSDAGVELNTYASSSLTLGTPCSLTFDDLIELNALNPPSGTSAPVFTLEGGEMVAVLQGSVYGNEANQYCLTSFTIELYVDPTNLASYGVRNFQTFVPDAGYDENSCPQ